MESKRHRYYNFWAWFTLDGKYHREDGPAIEYDDGRKEWWLNGALHRIDGPVVEYDNDGGKQWWVHDVLHRLDGPAVIRSDGREFWHINGYPISYRICEWAEEIGVDLNNLSEDDKLLIQIKWDNR